MFPILNELHGTINFLRINIHLVQLRINKSVYVFAVNRSDPNITKTSPINAVAVSHLGMLIEIESIDRGAIR